MSTAKLLLAGALALALPLSTSASIQVNYSGSGAAAGLNGEAIFELTNSTTLTIILTNTSVGPFGGMNGDAAMVLSSINFDLGGPLITGGSVELQPGSNVVKNFGSNWASVGTYLGNLNDEYGYSNEGIGNSTTGGPILVAITAEEVNSLLNGAITSHTNGGSHVTTFSGIAGLPGGLDFGLVAAGSEAFGNKKRFILDAVKLTLTLNSPLANLNFLSNGSYVEFGSDYAYVGGEFTIPEASSVLVWLGLAGCAMAVSRAQA